MSKKYMLMAIDLAKKANKKNEIPVGAVIVKDGKIISKGCNTRNKHNNVLGHAEIMAIFKAQKRLRDWRLNNCEMFVTLKPCELCEKIIFESRLAKVHYLIERDDKKKSYKQTFVGTFVLNDADTEKYRTMLKHFFETRR